MPEGRTLNQRVWELREIVPLSDPATGENSEGERISRVIEVGDFLCYPDDAGGWVPSEPRWVEAGDSFVSSGVGYRAVAPVETGRPVLYYPAWDDAEVVLAPVGLYVAQGDSEVRLRAVVAGKKGELSPADPTLLLYPEALGEGVDLELVLTASGIHQNVVFRKKLELPAGFSARRPDAPEDEVEKSARYVLRTEIYLDAIGRGPERGVVVRGKPVLLDLVGRLGEEVEEEIFFTRKDAETEQTIWSLGPSWIATGSRAGRRVGVARKSFERSADTGRTYLCETLPAWVVEELAESEYPWVWDYQTKQGTISTNTLWRGGETYWVKNLTVTNATLSIEPGATLKREGGTSFEIGYGGRIVAVGEPYAMITWCAANDAYCGETIPAGTGNPVGLLHISAGASQQSRLRYCKFRGAEYALLYIAEAQTEPIRDNVFLVDSALSGRRGIFVWLSVSSDPDGNPSESSVLSLKFANNLFVSPGGTATGIEIGNVWPIYDSNLEFSNNTFAGFSTGIRAASFAHVTVRENIFYQVAYPIDGGGSQSTVILRNAYNPSVDWRDSAPMVLTGSPFASCALGNYFLNTGSEGGKCRFSGFRSASAAGLGVGEYTVNLPVVFASSASIPEHTVTRSVLYSDPGTAVCLGYHSPRVDTLVGAADADVLLVVAGAFTLQAGSALAFRGSSEVRLSGDRPSLRSVGDPFGVGWNVVVDKRAAGTVSGLRIESPAKGATSGGTIRFKDAGSPLAEVRFTRFLFGHYSLLNDRVAGFTLSAQDARFEYGFVGLLGLSGAVRAENCLLRDCYWGMALFGSSGKAALCTLDRNRWGIYSFWNSFLEARDCLFTGDGLSTDYGISAIGTVVDEAYCAFWALGANKLVDGESAPLHERSFALPSDISPYDRDYAGESSWTIRCREFHNPGGSEILLEDAGSRPAQEGGYALGMRSATLKRGLRVLRDVGPVDIGFHEPVLDADGDGMADLWESWYQLTGTDDDGDGATNPQEYLQGSRPKLRPGETRRADDTDGDAWYARVGTRPWGWFGRDHKDEGAGLPGGPGGDGNQTWGFVAGAVGYDPRRPPYLQNMMVSGTNPPTCAVTIYWGHDVRNQPGEETWLPGTSSDLLWVRPATASAFAAYGPEDAPKPEEDRELKLRRHRLTGLACDTLHFYKIEFRRSGGTSPGTFTPVYTFRTWSAQAADFKFAVYGDTRDDDYLRYCHDHQSVCDALLANESFSELRWLVHVGDFVCIATTLDQWNQHFFWPAAKVLRHLPLVTVAGNHEYIDDGTLRIFRAFFDRPGEGDPYAPWDYNFKFGEAGFFVADTRTGTPTSGTVTKLFSDLGSSESHWKFVFFHYPGYAHSGGHRFEHLEAIRDIPRGGRECTQAPADRHGRRGCSVVAPACASGSPKLSSGLVEPGPEGGAEECVSLLHCGREGGRGDDLDLGAGCRAAHGDGHDPAGPVLSVRKEV